MIATIVLYLAGTSLYAGLYYLAIMRGAQGCRLYYSVRNVVEGCNARPPSVYVASGPILASMLGFGGGVPLVARLLFSLAAPIYGVWFLLSPGHAVIDAMLGRVVYDGCNVGRYRAEAQRWV